MMVVYFGESFLIFRTDRRFRLLTPSFYLSFFLHLNQNGNTIDRLKERQERTKIKWDEGKEDFLPFHPAPIHRTERLGTEKDN
jgi:hypothetical protein